MHDVCQITPKNKLTHKCLEVLAFFSGNHIYYYALPQRVKKEILPIGRRETRNVPKKKEIEILETGEGGLELDFMMKSITGYKRMIGRNRIMKKTYKH